jgi:hypothetical protein
LAQTADPHIIARRVVFQHRLITEEMPMNNKRREIYLQAEFLQNSSNRNDALTKPKSNSRLAQYSRAQLCCLLFFGFLGLVAWGTLYGLKTGYHRALISVDSAGFLQHSRVTPVRLDYDWMVGEYRQCTANAGYLGGEIDMLDCHVDEQTGWQATTVHQLPVHFWGRVVRVDHVHTIFDPDQAASADWTWRCEREATALKCWALN